MFPSWHPSADPGRGRPEPPAPARGPSPTPPEPAGRPAAEPPRGQPRHVLPDSDAVDEDLIIRPFLLTGGRTRPEQEGLHVETLIQSDLSRPTGSLRFEARRIVELCGHPTSVAELAATIGVPLGVIRVLVSDLVAEGRVTIVQREQLSVQMLERIRDRVRAL